ncbi:MAG: (d)CMP kinase [Phycisphaerae bacterium]|nr:(d)CMP kinase [Phycisphaerae bacterium]
MIITIDGPAGSGKSTAARQLADRLGVAYLDTGAMYRAVALAAVRAGVDPADADAVTAVARRSDIRLICGPRAARVFLDGVEVSDQIRSADISERTSLLSRIAGVRAELVARQRQIGKDLGSLVTEGRDQGSVVFPDADFKFFLDASPEVRARRRFDEMRAHDPGLRFEQVLSQIVSRDGADSTRAVAPLLVPEGATRLDTSDMTIAAVVDWLAQRIGKKGASR